MNNSAADEYKWPMTPQRIKFDKELMKEYLLTADSFRLDQCDMERYESANIQKLWDLYRGLL
jgi:hypothetical protein